MKYVLILLSLLSLSIVFLVGCSPTANPVDPEDSAAFITDRTGRQWDVTHARDNYDLNPDFYNYGLGLGAINSVDDPEIITEGESGYPEPDNRITVFGVNHNGEQRAYSVHALTRHEVFNDIYPGESEQYLAVTF